MQKNKITIYYAGSIRGAQNSKVAKFNKQIINHLKKSCIVLTEHISDKSIKSSGEELNDSEIYERDIKWLNSADVLIAEVSQPSLGVGYEIRYVIETGKKVLCLFNPVITKKKLSAMIRGCPDITVIDCGSIDEVIKEIDSFIK